MRYILTHHLVLILKIAALWVDFVNIAMSLQDITIRLKRGYLRLNGGTRYRGAAGIG
ncbi:hypothetical protein [Xenorhabdus indica]|uniref:hypothetical protein n=1 Tax=Xenorhabdus indica TaxID=333964 RepID=UPI00165746DB|nr:hypothetical protein [Xenorhabdus indica]